MVMTLQKHDVIARYFEGEPVAGAMSPTCYRLDLPRKAVFAHELVAIAALGNRNEGTLLSALSCYQPALVV